MLEVTIVKEIRRFCETTRLLYKNGAEHVPLEISLQLGLLYKFRSSVLAWFCAQKVVTW